nr:non-ribosomal peptide synthetase [Mycobacterium spongiae]
MTQATSRPALEDVIALSPLQRGLFAMATLADAESGDVDPYVIAMAAKAVGPLDVGLLRDCAAAMLTRHPNLRASFIHGNLSRPVQVIPSSVEVPWRHLRADHAEVAALEDDERRRPFDIGRGPLIRFLLLELPHENWHFTIVAHHIVIDGWSLPLFVTELLALYRAGGDTGALTPPPRSYRDYIGWLANWDESASRALWAQHLQGLDGPTLLSPALADSPPEVAIPKRTEVRLERDATTALTDAARGRGVTLNTLVQMAWATILSAFTGRSDVTFGVTVSGRPSELSGVETMIGLFINTVPLRMRLDPRETVGAQCLALQREFAVLRDHSYLGHAELRSIGGIGELFDTLLVYENFPPGAVVGAAEFVAKGAIFRPVAMESVSHFPVTIAAHLVTGELTVLVEVLDGALGTMAPKDLGRRLLAVVQRMVSGWDRPLRDIDVLLDGEHEPRTRGLSEASASGVAVHTRFTEIAVATPDSLAVSWSDGELTFHELDALTDRLAAALRRGGVAGETPVAITLARGPRYVVAMLAVLKAGGMIVPLDPGMPSERVSEIIRQASVPIVIDEEAAEELFNASVAAPPPADYQAAAVPPEHAAYAVFTSGTTGAPKGVIGTHKALSAYADDHIQRVLRPAAARIGRPLRVAHAWSFTFDAAWQPLVAMLDGHSVHIVDDDRQRDAAALVEAIHTFDLDMIDTTPSMFGQLHSAGLLDRVPLAVLALGGEALGVAAWQRIQHHCARTDLTAFNCYGPTETTVEAVVAAITEHARPVIGRPTRTTRAYVLDSWLRPVPDGVAGELYLAGDQLTRGYLARAPETAARFVAERNGSGGRMYRTGDIVRRLPDGGLEFLGRSDDQVKIRGFRVEPGEIAAVLNSHHAVRGCHVTARRHASGSRLTAYVAAGPNRPPVSELRAMLRHRLPRYLVPHHIVVLEELPLTPHGKIDENALAAITITQGPATQPETPTEVALVDAFIDVLGDSDVDVTADFLHLGLDSIASLAVVNAAKARGVALRARLILESDTIRELAAAVDAAIDSGEAGTRDAHHEVERHREIVPVPIVSWMYEYGNFQRFSQAVLIELPPEIVADQLETVLQAVLDRHEMLRARLDGVAGNYRLSSRRRGSVRAADILSRVVGPIDDAIKTHARGTLDSINPFTGAMVGALWCDDPEHDRSCLLLAVHHLATDVVSWYVLIAALASAWTQLVECEKVAFPGEYTTYREWSRLLEQRSRRAEICSQRDYWLGELAGPDPALGARMPDPTLDTWASLRASEVHHDVFETRAMLDKLAAASADIGAREFLLTALTVTLTSWRIRRGEPSDGGVLVAVEGHGREDALVDGSGSGAVAVDTSATVGWFTNVFPVRLGRTESPVDVDRVRRDPALGRELLRTVTDHVAAVPNRGLDYGLLRYQRRDPELVAAPHPQVEFNYLGRFHGGSRAPGGAPWSVITDPELTTLLPLASEPRLPLRYTFDVVAVVQETDAGPQLRTTWIWSESLTTELEATVLSGLWRDAVATLVDAL